MLPAAEAGSFHSTREKIFGHTEADVLSAINGKGREGLVISRPF